MMHCVYLSSKDDALIALSANSLNNFFFNNQVLTSGQSSKCALILQRTYITKAKSTAPNFGGFFDLFRYNQPKYVVNFFFLVLSLFFFSIYLNFIKYQFNIMTHNLR